MAFVRWIFEDMATSETYTLYANPSEGGAPTKQKNFLYQEPAAPDGMTLIFEGRRKSQPMEFSGFVLREAHYVALNEWYEHANPIKITDDLGRQFIVMIEELDLTRKHSVSHVWRHDYKIKATVLVTI